MLTGRTSLEIRKRPMIRKFNSAKVVASPFYSHAGEAKGVERTVYVAGQVGQRQDGGIADGIGAQTTVAIENLQAVLAEAGMSVADVVKYTVFLTDPAHFDGFAGSALGMLSAPPPPITLIYVKALAAPQMLVEIEAVAAK